MTEKWADYLITGVRYDESSCFIEIVETRKDNGKDIGSPKNSEREIILKNKKSGTSYRTSTQIKNDKGEKVWQKGASVEIINVDGIEYLRTDKNKTKKDNLEKLPEI